MSGRLAERLAVSAAATAIAAVMGAGVFSAPSERMFGMEIVGWHHDPFTVMQQFERPMSVGVYSQPVTDFTGALIARVTGPVAAYNAVILLSFPLAALTAFLLARHLTLSRTAATVAALAFAFSPFHIAHAAYHPHIAQVQWLPLYLLALWRCLDAATPAAVALLGLATVAVTLSNFYGGLIAAVITPAAVAAYWLVMRPAHKRPLHALTITVITLASVAACGLVYVWYAAGAVVANRDLFAAPRADLFLYSAKWWSYLVPPVAHPLAGSVSQRIWAASDVTDGLLEQQVYLGWGILALGGIAAGRWVWHIRNRQSAVGIRVPVLVFVAITALVCSLSPERMIGSQMVAAPSALIYSVVPMFRAYARFGVVVQLMAALLAGIGVDFLRRARTTGATYACVALVALAAIEYVVAPTLVWRDVLPTTAHRWVARQPDEVRAFDCAPLTREAQSIQWLSGYRVLFSPTYASDCIEPNFADKLSARGYTHLLVRQDTIEARWLATHAPTGFRAAANLEDGQVLAVTAAPPPIYTAAMPGFFRREHSAKTTWRWMERDAGWEITNTGLHAIVTTLAVELWPFQHARTLELMLDGNRVEIINVARGRRRYEVGPLAVPPGDHLLMFHSAELPTPATAKDDPRMVSFAVGTWKWTVGTE